MTEAENETIARRVLEEIFVQGNVDTADELFAPGYVGHQPGGELLNGPQGIKDSAGAYRAAFPDLQITIEDVVASGDQVVTRWTFRGTHQGELQGIAPTGKQVTMTGIRLARIENGQVVEEWDNFDELGMMQQLGVIQAAAQA